MALAMRDEEGALVPDRRASGAAVPSWVTDPFPPNRRQQHSGSFPESPLRTTFRAYEALSQRGKGGVIVFLI